MSRILWIFSRSVSVSKGDEPTRKGQVLSDITPTTRLRILRSIGTFADGLPMMAKGSR